MSHFHKNLEYLMRRQNETQASVAEFVGVTQSAVFNWLRDTMPRPEQLEKIAQLFEVTVDDLTNNELPHRRKIEALTELEHELKGLKASWGAVAKRLKEKAAKSAETQDYSNAVQNDWMGSGIESCASELSKILEGYFPEEKVKANLDQQSENNSPPPASGWRIPTGFKSISPAVAPKAFGATLGNCPHKFINPEGVVSTPPPPGCNSFRVVFILHVNPA